MNRLPPTLLIAISCFFTTVSAQHHSSLPANEWVDSVFNTFSRDEKIAQLMVIRAHSNLGPDHIAKVTNVVKKYNVGALCFFQGGPVRQAQLTNIYQQLAKTPLMITIDGEWGLGMRLDSVTRFPYQLTLGAMDDTVLMYKMGVAVGEQCKRLGVHVNYAPVVDINNNPSNPVIGYRSFGEDKYRVATLGAAYTRGMQAAGIMACAKHFPGHGDVSVDSHFDLPVVNKTIAQLDSLELYPFRAQVQAGVGSVMIAHLFIPSVDNTANTATSISKNAVTGLLRDSLGYQGLTFTDALEMKGVAKYFPGGTIAVEALIAGNDMLCLPTSVPETIAAVKKAIRQKRLSWALIDEKVKKVLLAKYRLGLNNIEPVDLTNLTDDLNSNTDKIRSEVASKTVTLLKRAASKDSVSLLPLFPNGTKKIAYVAIGTSELNAIGKRMKNDYNADVFLFSHKDGDSDLNRISSAVTQGKYDAVVIGIHNFSNRPANNYDLSANSVRLWNKLNSSNAITLVFGNVLATGNFCEASSLYACYQDDNITQELTADILEGKRPVRGTLPVSVCSFKYGDGLFETAISGPDSLRVALDIIDSIAMDGIGRRAYPGCVIMAVHNGEIIYHKAFGHYEYEQSSPPMTTESIFDLASVTKISATTMAIMKLYEEGKIDLQKRLGNYLPVVRGTDKASIKIEDVLLHQAGFVPFIQFYKETINADGVPDPALYSTVERDGFHIRVAEGLYLRDDWDDTIMQRIVKSPIARGKKYVYSDIDFIFLGKIVEAISGQTLDQYVEQNFYSKMGMTSTGFKPRSRFAIEQLVPTELEKNFRRQLIRGDVHDEGASMFGGVAGHAGLFSDAYDLAKLYQMLLNGGELNGQRYFDSTTIRLFTAYHSDISRRGFGFDKPEKDNATRKDPYPSYSVSPETYGHTGFTGTCVWVDPQVKLVYIFLSNRVYPSRDDNKLSQLNIRPKIQEALYKALGLRQPRS
ncbi:MAG: glycoside hydrolase family 3 N-terminal domain-containing protein [Chitinophagaceae bacterium]